MSANTQLRATAMGLAFVNAAAAPKANRKAVTRVIRVVDKNPNAGLVKERAVNANVSYRTAQKLKQQEIL